MTDDEENAMSRDDFMKIKGVWEVRRRIRVPALRHPADGEMVMSALEGLPGVRRIRTDPRRRRVEVLYDVTGTDYHTLEQVLAGIGFPPAGGWWARLRGNWYQYLDSNGRDNASAPEPPCCSNPKGIVNQHKR